MFPHQPQFVAYQWVFYDMYGHSVILSFKWFILFISVKSWYIGKIIMPQHFKSPCLIPAPGGLDAEQGARI